MYKIIFFSILSLICYSFIAGTETIDLGEIVITPSSSSSTIQRRKSNVTVIDQKEIKNSNAQTIADVLRKKSGITVRDISGSGTKSSVDLRGFGEYATQNTLVLIDGRRVNEIDLSDTNWLQIPLQHIEKVEIIKGSGNVRYGDNAVGGVINIVTRKGKKKPSLTIETLGGSYQTQKDVVVYEGGNDICSSAIDYTYNQTNGYRTNSGYRSNDIGGTFRYAFTDLVSLTTTTNYHDADFGLPGALRESDFPTFTRRQTKFPDDTVGETDWYTDTNAALDLHGCGLLATSLSFRRRRVDNNLLSSKAIDGRKIDTISIRPQYTREDTLLAKDNVLALGIDYYHTNFVLGSYSYQGLQWYSGAKVRDTDIRKNSLGCYIQDTLALADNLSVNAGYRYEKDSYSFNSSPQAGPWTSDPLWNNTIVDSALSLANYAGELGIQYQIASKSTCSFTVSQGFRTPAVDEYYSLWANPPVNTSLKPQKHTSYELSVTTNGLEKINGDFHVFFMDIIDELFYDPLTYTNCNYDKTNRLGVETDLHYTVTDIISLIGSYTFTKAVFGKGIYDGNQIPLVPYHKAMVGIQAELPCGVSINLYANFIGKRYYINDQANAYPLLNRYVTADVKIVYEKNNKSIFLTINNLFNKQYSEYGAISTIYRQRADYPSPERNILAGISIKF